MKYSVVLIVALGFTSALRADESLYDETELHYSIKLPEGWRRLPPDVAAGAGAELSRLTGLPAPNVVAWFQRSNEPVGSYPYVMLTRQICKPPPLGEIANGVRNYREAAVAQFDRNFKGIASGSKLSEPWIDRIRKVVVFEVEQSMEIGGVKQVKSKTCLIPCKLGVAQINCSAAAEDWDRASVPFDSILDSVTFESGYGASSGGGFNFAWLLVIGAVVIVGVFLRKLSKRQIRAQSTD